jgi:thioredoxin reductase
MKNIIVLGGGTAGLMSAIMLKTRFNNLNITVIKSKEIGVIGVGEGSTEHFADFCQYVGISVKDLINATDATLKKGIKFTNWNGDNTHRPLALYLSKCAIISIAYGNTSTDLTAEGEIAYARNYQDYDIPDSCW